MNIGKKVLTSITLKTGLVLAMVAATVLAVIPQVKDTAIGADAESCEVVTTTPALNAFPVTTSFPRQACHDRPFLWAGLNGNYSYTHTAQVGDEIEIRSYVHNSAPDGGPAAYNVRVNFNVDTQQGASHTVSANATSDNAGGKSGSVTINTPENARLEVVSGSGQILDFSGNPDGSGTGSVQLGANGATAHFGSMLACFKYSKFIVFKVKVVGAPVPPPAEQKFDFSAAPNPVCVGDRSTYTVSNASAGLNGKMIFWSSTKNGQATGENMAGYNQFVSNGFWSDQGNTWTSADIGNWTKTATIDNISRTASFTVKDCAVTPPPAEQKFNLSVTPNPVCVGDRSTYTISNATEGLRNKMIFWSSTKNGQATGENLSGYNQFINASGFFTDQGNTWTSADIGNWTKTATVYGPGDIPVSRSVTFEVKSCEQPPQQLVCTPASQTVNADQPASFVASGGTGSYSWSAPGGSATSGTGAYFTTSYAASGSKTVTLSSGGQTAVCSVTVRQVPVIQAIIQLNKFVRNVTAGGSFAESASAKTGDTVEYKIEVGSANNIALTNVRVTDTFTPGLNYIDQTLTVNGQSHAPGLTSGGLTFSTLDGGKLTIIYRATVVASSGSIINTAQATADNASNVATDQAVVNVIFVRPGQPSLTIEKQVKNVTKGGGYSSAATAAKNDTVSYRVVVANAGDAAADNVYVSDFGASGLTGLSGLTVSRTYSGSLPGNLSLGTLAAGESVTITYQAAINIENGQVLNTATVSASNAATRSSYAVVSVSTTQQPPNPGNYYYNSNNNYCVNNSCNTTYINYYGQQVPSQEFRQLSVRKQVRNLNSGTFGDSVTANNNDTVEFEIVVTNTGSQVVNNVRLADTWTGGLSYVSGSTRIDGSGTGDGWSNNSLSLGSLLTGQQKRIVFQARVISASGSSIQNTAVASGDSVSSVQDDAWVFVSGVAGGNVNLLYSKRAQNDTKGADAMSVVATREDYITYTLTVTNNGNTPATNFVITDDLSQVLPYADVVDNGGGFVSGNVITFPGLTIPSGSSVSKSFRVRVKYFLADNLSYVMTNTYGNTVTVRINTPQIKGAFIAPRTGADTAAFLFAGLLTSASALVKKRKYLLKLIFT